MTRVRRLRENRIGITIWTGATEWVVTEDTAMELAMAIQALLAPPSDEEGSGGISKPPEARPHSLGFVGPAIDYHPTGNYKVIYARVVDCEPTGTEPAFAAADAGFAYTGRRG